MSEADCKSLAETLQELESISPGVPLLALGQTIFWDEPMKAGVAQALKRSGSSKRFVAGIHDTDYFAKVPSGRSGKGKFKTLPHNDTTTRGLWSAAGEFSALFGSETVVTRELLQKGGVRLDMLNRARPGFLDEATEAWGWRGIVSLDDRPPITAELPLKGLFPELRSAFDWAVDTSLQSLAGQGKEYGQQIIDEVRSAMCDAAEKPNQTLSSFYRDLAPTLYEFAANSPVDLDTTATSELLKFNTQTCELPRFASAGYFVDSRTAKVAQASYDEAIHGSAGLYELARFGTGAIPYDLVIPGQGRGTIRLGNRGAVIMTPRPQFLSFKRPLASLRELAEATEQKFGPNCVLVGKAVALISQLAREFVFVFHEGASGYVRHSIILHRLLRERLDPELKLHPILRVRYDAWNALNVCCSWLRLPEPLHRPFGTEELCAPSFADRWECVGEHQEQTLQDLGKLQRPTQLIEYLDRTLGGSWKSLSDEYKSLHGRLDRLNRELHSFSEARDKHYTRIRELSAARVDAERRKGDQFRAEIFEKEPAPEAAARRDELTREVESIIQQLEAERRALKELRLRQYALTCDPEIQRIHTRRQAIELEAELKRTRLIQGAVFASRGLHHAAVRPSAWWFPLVCPDGLWFRETVETAKCYLEPLI